MSSNLILRYEFELVSKPEETRKELEKRVLTGTPIVTCKPIIDSVHPITDKELSHAVQPPTADFVRHLLLRRTIAHDMSQILKRRPKA